MKVNFAQRLKELRLENNLSQKVLAEKFHVSETTIYHWENGMQQPSFELLADLAMFFNVSVGYLLGVEE